jgi:hypothetical protein
MKLSIIEVLRLCKAWTDEERQKPADQQSPVLARELRLAADTFILASRCERATQDWLRGKS